MTDSASHKARTLAALRSRLAAGAAAPRGHVVPAGLCAARGPAPGPRLALGRVHEIRADRPGHGAALGFAARCLAGVQADTRPVLWAATPQDRREDGRLYLPGLAQSGLRTAQLLVATPRRADDLLWVLEEALASGALAGVAAWVGALGLTQSRRLTLAAERHGTPLFLLRPWADLEATACETRWCVTPRPSAADPFDPAAPGPAVWKVDMIKARQGPPATWEMMCDDPQDALDLAAFAGNRPLAPDAWPGGRHARTG